MKRLFLTVIVCLIAASAAARRPAARAAMRQDVRRSERAGRTDAEPSKSGTRRRNAQTDEGARMRLERTVYDFGDVARKGGDLVHEFGFTNEGTAPLVVLRVVTSCSCLKATYTRQPVAPGKSGVIRIVYEPHKSEPGTFNRVIQIYSNSVDGRELITVQGNSIETPGR